MRPGHLKVLLIFPPGVQLIEEELKKSTPPLGLMYLASFLEDYGYEVRILDTVVEGYNEERQIADDVIVYGLSDQEIVSCIQEFEPDVVGISCLFSSTEISLRHVAKVVKDVDASIIVVVGGSHPSMTANTLLVDQHLDFVVLGEGETTLFKLLQVLEHTEDQESIEGLAWREGSRICVANPSKFIEDLDSLPFPARHLVPLSRYSELRAPHGDLSSVPYTPIITSRGCPGRCVFCLSRKLWGSHHRCRSASNVVAEIVSVVTRYGIKEIHFEDDNLTVNRERAEELFLNMAQHQLDLVWATPNGLSVNSLDEPLLDLMKKCGCYSISLALESGSEEVLRNIVHKAVDLTKARRLVKYARSIGLRVNGFFMLGFPGESRRQIMATLDLIEELDLDNAGLLVATPYPGTDLLEICVREDLLTVEVNKIDYLRLRHSKGAKGIIRTDQFDPDYLEYVVNKWNDRQLRLSNRQSRREIMREWNNW